MFQRPKSVEEAQLLFPQHKRYEELKDKHGPQKADRVIMTWRRQGRKLDD